MTTATSNKKTQDVANILSDLTAENQERSADELANYLPGTMELSDEIDVGEAYLGPLLDKLQMDAVKFHAALARVLERIVWGLPDDLEDLTADEIKSLRIQVEKEMKASKLTKKEKEALETFEAQIDKGLRQSAESLRAIRDGRLYREEFASWESYCSARWHFSGTSGDNKITWLKIAELLEAKFGKEVKLGVVQAKELLKLWDYPELLVEALVAADENAASEGRKRKDDDVRSEAERRLSFVRNQQVPELMSLAEFEALKDSGIQEHNLSHVVEFVREKQGEGLNFDEAMDVTEDVVVARTRKNKAAKESELRTLNAKIRSIQEKDDLQNLLNRKKSLQTEIANLDYEKETGDNANEREVGLRVVANDPDNTDEPESEVWPNLEDAFHSLEAAFSGIWPEQRPDALDEIRILAENCEDKLAEIVAKVKEILADVGELNTDFSEEVNQNV